MIGEAAGSAAGITSLDRRSVRDPRRKPRQIQDGSHIRQLQ